jgi:DNA polymerase I
MKSRDTITQPLLSQRPDNGWRPVLPPDLHPGTQIGFDFEYKPGRNPTKDKPFAFSVWVPGLGGYYVPWGHEGGGNLDEDICRRWLINNIRGRDFFGLNLKAEVHQMHNWGLDVDALDLKPHDVAFEATLLDENRMGGFSLEALAEEHLPEGERKVHPMAIDPKRFYLAHAGELAERGISDSQLAWRLHEVLWPKIQAEEMERVLDLENGIITAVCEMERNGARLDRAKLEQWDYQVDERVNDLFMMTYRELGIGCNPDSRPDMIRLFQTLGVSVEYAKAWNDKKDDWEQNFSEEALLAAFKKTNNRVIHRVLELRKFKSLSAKYLKKYLAKIDSGNILRYTLHQLRGDSTGSLKGTVTGRFSCGGGHHDYPDHVGINIQQVPKAEDQIETLGPDFVIRELFIPDDGAQMGASDASQIEFRLFAHYANAKSIIEAYNKDPMTDFHMLVTKVFCPHLLDDQDALDSERKHKKHQNFGKIYRLGREKLARKLGLPCTCLIDWKQTDGNGRRINKFWDNRNHEAECLAREANRISDEYEALFPEAEEVCTRAEEAARTQGFVRTLYGRRRHFPDGKKLHKAFNAADQGSAADIFKDKLRDLYRERKALGIKLRMPVHDEVVFDFTNGWEKVHELLDTQSIQLKVPILWETGVGPNWKRANLSEKKEEKATAKYWRKRKEAGID